LRTGFDDFDGFAIVGVDVHSMGDPAPCASNGTNCFLFFRNCVLMAPDASGPPVWVILQVPFYNLSYRHHPKEYFITTYGWLLSDPQVGSN
jgi:hypothetical protein